ncbi:TPA: hypothetical protein QEM98_003530 [Stenotrophomonas maltophilia]|nr:hypothetical protein [Stenotrophomonas maltophilia]
MIAAMQEAIIKQRRAASFAEDLQDTVHIPTSMSQLIVGPPGIHSHLQQLRYSEIEGIDFPWN